MNHFEIDSFAKLSRQHSQSFKQASEGATDLEVSRILGAISEYFEELAGHYIKCLDENSLWASGPSAPPNPQEVPYLIKAAGA